MTNQLVYVLPQTTYGKWDIHIGLLIFDSALQLQIHDYRRSYIT